MRHVALGFFHICVIPSVCSTAPPLLALTHTRALSGEQATLPCLYRVQPFYQLRSPFTAFSSCGSRGPLPSTSLSCSSCLFFCGNSLSHLRSKTISLFNQSANESLPLPAASLMPILGTIPGALQGCRFWLLSLGASSPVP